MPVSLKDVADHCGVSRQTVGLILSQRPGLRYSATTREKVMASAKSLGYRQHASAVAMRKQCFQAIAFLQDSNAFRSYASPRMLNAVERGCREHKLSTHFGQFTDVDQVLPQSIDAQTVDGYIINYHSEVPTAVSHVLRDANTPAVWVNTKQAHDAVYVDEYASGCRLAEELLAAGHRHIAYLEVDRTRGQFSVESHYSVSDRFNGVNDTLTKAGQAITRWGLPVGLAGSVKSREVIDPLKKFLEGMPEVTAVISSCHDTVTQRVIIAAIQVGRRVPEDLSVVSFSNQTEGGAYGVSSMRTPWAELGSHALDQLIKTMQSSTGSMPSDVIQAQWTPGETLKRPSSHP